MALGFRHAELQEIWSGLDPNEEGSLTKEEVANIFSYEFVKTTELTTKAVESIKDLASKKKEEGRREAVASKKKSPSREK